MADRRALSVLDTSRGIQKKVLSHHALSLKSSSRYLTRFRLEQVYMITSLNWGTFAGYSDHLWCDTFYVELPVRCLFESPTVRGCEHIEAASCKNHQPMLPIEPRVRDGNCPVLAQARLWFLDRLVGRVPPANIPVALKIIGPLNVHALQQV